MPYSYYYQLYVMIDDCYAISFF